jgi:cobalt-zinc-cadmium efflux system membrane fusion protein
MSLSKLSVVVAVVAGAAHFTGCNKADNAASAVTQVSEEGHEEGWWCAEHGVPEEVCTRCNPKLVADFKAKGDWCKEHDCPESQCFVCHPEKEAEFAALYEAKYGKQPPKPGTGEHEHEHRG